jgi:SAM-dependent methyltransferase
MDDRRGNRESDSVADASVPGDESSESAAEGDDGGDAAGKRQTAARFGAAADAYFESDVHRYGADVRTLASWCADATRALDVATGGGHTAGAVAEAGVPRVVALDAAPEMVATAVAEYGVEGVVGDAERLPFDDDAFDAVTCRIAAHHFPDPEAFVDEVARVLEPGGTFAFEDNVAPEDGELAAWLDGVERLRDPTHVGLLSASAWTDLFADAGLSVTAAERARTTLDFDAWVDRTGVSAADEAELHRRFRDAPTDAHDRFEVEFDAGADSGERELPDGARVVSWANPKAVMRVRRE